MSDCKLFSLYIVSGEGEIGTREPYRGALTPRAIRSRITRECSHGDRWARLDLCEDGDPVGEVVNHHDDLELARVIALVKGERVSW